jgi:hypothetical protein
MLSREENELLTRVHAGTPMGRLFRRYWIPALLSEEIPNSDCPPVRVRLRQDSSFRDTQGESASDEHCSHRGLRCFTVATKVRSGMHLSGWKYDVEGNVLEPANGR